ncbi:glycosyltransferase [Trebonia kvetii]|uniref:Glycosyltransferase n=1 Tax=Trebonia kvetii TaxID=2480626 RepID=A0A6P2BNF0_9ACTN|nr:glycosyltransferase [Trebonia kvetii]TVY99632.1 glycosyltransferase [Trebonia kvetii]
MLGLAIACVISAVAWLYLVAAHGGFWLTDQRLPVASADPADPADLADPEPRRWPSVAAVVPARNEADAIPGTLPALLAQEYPGEFRVFLVDDNSDDGTGALAAELGEKAARDGGAPLTVVPGKPRPDGWAGKVWAMAQGLAALVAVAPIGQEPDYVLFTDADIAWAPGVLRDLVASAEDGDRAMVSQMAMLRAQTAWERVIVPAFVYFFAQLYPFRKVNDPKSRVAAAAGGCMLIRRPALEAAGGLEPIRGALIDDVALGTLLKRHGNRIWLGFATEVRSTRPYPSLASLWHMIARSAYVQLRYNPLLLAGTIVGLLLLYVAPPAGLIGAIIASAVGHGGPATGIAGVAGLDGWVFMTLSYVPMLRFYRLSALRAPGLPLIAVLYAAMTADSARRHYSGRAVSWRGRAATL